MVISTRGSVFAVTGSFPRAAAKPGRKPFKRHQYATNKQRNALGSLQRELFALAAFFGVFGKGGKSPGWAGEPKLRPPIWEAPKEPGCTQSQEGHRGPEHPKGLHIAGECEGVINPWLMSDNEGAAQSAQPGRERKSKSI